MSAQKTIAVVVVAAGTGARIGGGPKQYRLLAGRPVLARTIETFLRRPDVSWVLPVIPPRSRGGIRRPGLSGAKLLPPVLAPPPGRARFSPDSRPSPPGAPDLVLIQDAAAAAGPTTP